MDSTVETLTRLFDRAEDEVLTALKIENVPFRNIEHLLSSYRLAGEDLIFHDFTLPASKDAQSRLWDTHSRINNLFRKEFVSYSKADGQRKTVSRRKMEKHFLDFIKSSVRFYRGFIQRLASNFSNVEEVWEVAGKFNLELLPVTQTTAADASMRALILKSCHECLVHLGDLSRYRETELQSDDRNWGPANGYYSLASTIMPASGAPYNQLAVIAQKDQDALRAVYYLYRAMLAESPYPAARDNIEREFKKIRGRWNKQKHSKRSSDDGPYADFQDRFVAFQAKCYTGAEFEERGDLETDLIYEFATDLVPNAEPRLLYKICIISIAAEAAAVERYQDDVIESSQALLFFQSFNLKLLCQLFQVLIVNLRHSEFSKSASVAEASVQGDLLQSTVRRLLPILRLYSTWLRKEIPSLAKLLATEEPLAPAVQALWEVYAEALTTLQSAIFERPDGTLDYLLAEDKDVIAFKPLAETVAFTYQRDEGTRARREAGTRTKRVVSREEMLHRVNDLIESGMKITQLPEAEIRPPITYSGQRFTCQVVRTAKENHEAMPRHPSSRNIAQPARSSPEHGSPGLRERQQAVVSEKNSSADSAHAAMRQMVDSIVEDRPRKSRSSQGQRLSTPSGLPLRDENFNSPATRLTAADFVRQMQRSPQQAPHSPSLISLPTLPTVFNTPFTPQPGETIISSRPGSSHATLPFTAMASPTHLSSGNSSRAFHTEVMQQQQHIQARSSPQRSIPEPSSWVNYYDTPIGMHSLAFPQQQQQQHQVPPQSSPWLSSSTPMAVRGEEVKKAMPERALFGAIGDNTPGRTPTSAQPE